MSRESGRHYEGDLRRQLLDLAVDTLAEEGPHAVSYRAMARELGVSHAAPGKHFPDRRSLFTAIATEAFEGLRDGLQDAAKDSGDPLAAAMRAYAAFAASHPGHFQLMWRSDLYDGTSSDLSAAAAAAYATLETCVSEAQRDRGWLPGVPLATATAHVWSSVHGLCQLWDTPALQRRFPSGFAETVTEMVSITLRDLHPTAGVTGHPGQPPPG